MEHTLLEKITLMILRIMSGFFLDVTKFFCSHARAF